MSRIRKCRKCGREVMKMQETAEEARSPWICGPCERGEVAYLANYAIKPLLEKANRALDQLTLDPVGEGTLDKTGETYERFLQLSKRVHKLLSDAATRRRHGTRT